MNDETINLSKVYGSNDWSSHLWATICIITTSSIYNSHEGMFFNYSTDMFIKRGSFINRCTNYSFTNTWWIHHYYSKENNQTLLFKRETYTHHHHRWIDIWGRELWVEENGKQLHLQIECHLSETWCCWTLLLNHCCKEGCFKRKHMSMCKTWYCWKRSCSIRWK